MIDQTPIPTPLNGWGRWQGDHNPSPPGTSDNPTSPGVPAWPGGWGGGGRGGSSGFLRQLLQRLFQNRQGGGMGGMRGRMAGGGMSGGGWPGGGNPFASMFGLGGQGGMGGMGSMFGGGGMGGMGGMQNPFAGMFGGGMGGGMNPFMASMMAMSPIQMQMMQHGMQGGNISGKQFHELVGPMGRTGDSELEQLIRYLPQGAPLNSMTLQMAMQQKQQMEAKFSQWEHQKAEALRAQKEKAIWGPSAF